MDMLVELTKERRARLAAERLLQFRQRELHEANAKLGKHANALTEEIVEKREEAVELREQTDKALQNLEEAQTEIHIAKRRLWDSIETIEDGFAVFDEDDRMIIANSAYLAMFDDMEIVGQGISCGELVDLLIEEGIADIGASTPQAWRETMVTRWSAAQLQPKVIKLWNGEFYKMLDRRSDDGDTVSLALNITDTIKNQRELERAMERAQEGNRAKSAFLARMSHELRTPMNGVVGMADLLTDTELDQEQSLYVDTIKSSGEALLVLINDVLDFSKLEAAKLVLANDRFDLEALLVVVLRLFQPALQAKPVELILDYDVALPRLFVGDQGRIRQVLTNLIGNAVKFTESGAVTITVSGTGEQTVGPLPLRICVHDTGIGIPAEKVDYEFGEFNQVEDDKNRKFEGTGLGLAITRQLVELMGGKISVSSEQGVGSEFVLELAIDVPDDLDQPKDALPDWVRASYIVGEQSAAQSILLRQLSSLGPTAKAISWAEFSDLQDLRRQDLLVAELADVEGVEAAQLLKAAWEEAGPSMLIYAQGPVPELHEADTIRILRKPIIRSELLAAVQAMPEPEPGAVAAVAAEAENPEPINGQANAMTGETIGSTDIVETSPGPVVPVDAPQTARRMRILAAEDNKTNRLVFQKLVKTLDIELTFAENGREAVEKWDSTRPDLVFMDISMPDMDGKEATARIRAKEAELGLARTPIVALTAHAVSGDEDDILSAGLDYYLTKPLRKEPIFERIDCAMPDAVKPVFPVASTAPVTPAASTAGLDLTAVAPSELPGKDAARRAAKDGDEIAKISEIWGGLEQTDTVARVRTAEGSG